ncbi:MAG: hypothetical protein JWP94_2941 [Mucilaginibacter sp.]|nr:hypothetical protein [Mucilaginibacter sp.]
MNTDKQEKGERVTNYGLAATVQQRRDQYLDSVQFMDRFQSQYSPKYTYYSKDFMKVIVWDDGNGERHCETEEISDDEKELLDEAMDIIQTYEFYFHDEYLSILQEQIEGKENDIAEVAKDMQTVRSHDELIKMLATEQVASPKLPEEKYNTGLSKEQISTLRDMRTIREGNQEPGHNRLADFSQHEMAQDNFSLDDPNIGEGEQIDVKEHQGPTGQDLIDALVHPYCPQPQLYGFEVHEDGEHHRNPENPEQIREEPGHDELER